MVCGCLCCVLPYMGNVGLPILRSDLVAGEWQQSDLRHCGPVCWMVLLDCLLFLLEFGAVLAAGSG